MGECKTGESMTINIEKLSQMFNNGLLSVTYEHDSSDDSSYYDDHDVDAEQHLSNFFTSTSYYYSLHARNTTVNNASNAYHPVKQPRNHSRVQALL